MIELPLKIVLLFILIWIAIQDLRHREVWNYHFLIFGVTGTILFYTTSSSTTFYFASISINILIALILLLLTKILMRFIFNKKEYLGLGDIFFFFGFAACFPTIGFINFFVFSILFTFVMHLLLKKGFYKTHKTVPLAGFMAIFLCCIYLAHWLGIYTSIYVL